MTTLNSGSPTLLDFAKRRDPGGKIAKIVELLEPTNDILQDMHVREANSTWGHKTTVRTGLPEPTWLKFYKGVQPTKSTTAEVIATCGMLGSLVEIDKDLADAENETQEFIASEVMAHAQKMGQEIAETMFSGDEATEPETFSGFLSHFNSASAANAENIIGYSSSGPVPEGSDNSSIWLVGWGADTCFTFFPRGSKAGMSVKNYGDVISENIDGVNGRKPVYRTYLKWDLGLCVRDWRSVVRVVFDSEDLTKSPASGPDLIDLLVQGIEQLPTAVLNSGGVRIYANRRTRSFLRRQIANKVATSSLTMDMVGGKHVMHFDGIPFRRCDAITNAEGAIGA